MNEARRSIPFFFIALACLVPSGLSGQALGYSLFPSYQEIRWDDAFGLEDARFIGARVGLDFGPYVSVQPFYEWADDVELRDDYTPPADAEVADLFDVELFGADLQVNLGSGSLVPFARGGGGILRTRDDVEGERDRVFLRYGGGVRIGLGGNLGLEIFGERVSTRMSEPFVPGAVPVGSLPENGIVHSLVVGAGARVPLGGGYSEAEYGGGVLPGIFVQPYVTRLDFADELNLARLNTAGVRAGVDVNRLVGLRGYYWRGVNDDFDDFVDVRSFGAEAQFQLNSGPGLSPFLLVGAGRIEFLDDFRDPDGNERDTQDHMTLGGGVSFGLSDNIRLEASARNLLMTPGSEIQDVSDPDELVGNWQYGAGLSFSFGTESEGPANTEAERLRRELETAREENERLRSGEAIVVDGVEPVVPAARDTIDAPRTIVVPVPEVGEIILRYGAAYARVDTTAGAFAGALAPLDSAALAEAVRAAVAAEVDSTIVDDERIADAVRAELDRLGVDRPQPVQVAVGPDGARDPDDTYFVGRRLATLIPFAGLQASDPTQLLLGIRADLGDISESVPVAIQPEAMFGLGEGSATLLVGVNGRFGFDIGTEYDLRPFVEAGVALASRHFLTVNLGYGAEFAVGDDANPTRLFISHRGINAFDEHQFLVGVMLPR